MYRAQQGAADPTLVFLPILLAHRRRPWWGFGVAVMQQLRLRDPWYWPGWAVLLCPGGFMAILASLSTVAVAAVSSAWQLGPVWHNYRVLLAGAANAWQYECFVEGAKEGFNFA